MRTGRHLETHAPFTLFLTLTATFTSTFFSSVVSASVIRGVDVAHSSRSSHPPPSSRGLPAPLTNPAYLPAQIGGIVGSYAFCLVIVAVSLLLLSKRRREHLLSGEEFDPNGPEFQFEYASQQFPETLQLQDSVVPFAVKSPTFFGANFSYPGALQGANNGGPAYPASIVSHPVPGYAPSVTSGDFPVYNGTGSPISPTETHGGTIVSSLHAKGNLYLSASYASSFRAPGVDPSVDQDIVTADREMAQSQLEEMYKYVMEQEEAKANGVVLEGPPLPLSPQSGNNSTRSSPVVPPGANVGFNNPPPPSIYNPNHRKDESMASSTATLLKKEKSKKPLSLNLSKDKNVDGGEKTSRTSSILSALKSPRSKKKMQGISISSPIMTPMSGTFPRFGAPTGNAPYGYGNGGGYAEAEEMNTIPPRQYAPAAPPPVPTLQQPKPREQQTQQPTPETSPLSTLSIDERLGATIVKKNNLPPVNTGAASRDGHARNLSLTASVDHRDPDSAISAQSATTAVSNNSGDSSAPLVGLPTSPKPGANRFPSLASLPASPRSTKTTFFNNGNQPLSPTGVAFASASPVSTVSGLGRSNAPSAVRTGGGLPLRAYEPSITSPSFATHNQTKQTVFERAQPLSPGLNGSQTPWTGAPVPYTPYQPFSPVIPMTPSLVTKADRKRMRKLEPKTPTMEMVRSTEDLW